MCVQRRRAQDHLKDEFQIMDNIVDVVYRQASPSDSNS
jgi:hypothetical protein